MKKLTALLLVLVMVMGALAACAPSNQTSTNNPPVDSETPLVIQWDQADNTDKFEAPHKSTGLSYHTVMMWNQLFKFDRKYAESDERTYAWELATGYTRSEDNKSITYTLREGAKWSDGEPITVEDVVFSVMAAIKDPVSNQAGVYKDLVGYQEFVNGETDELAGVTTKDNTITFTMTITSAVQHYNPYVLPAHCFEGIEWKDISTARYWYAPVTSGPYKFVKANFPDYAMLTRNELYFGEPAGIKNVTCVSYEAATTDAAIASMIQGTSDITTRTVTSSVQLASQIVDMNRDCKILTMRTGAYRALMFNDGTRTDGNNNELLVNNKNVRLAISLLVDEDTIADYAEATAVKVLGDPRNPLTTHEFDNANKSLDLEKAKQLLDAAGWNYNDKIEIFCYYADQISRDVLEIIKADAAKIGVKIEIDVVTENASTAMNTERNWDLLFYQAPGTEKCPSSAASQLCTTRTYRPSTGANYAKYKELWTAWSSIADSYSPEGIAASQALAAFNYQNTDIIPIYSSDSLVVYNAARVQIPETAFDNNDEVLDLHLWKMLK